MDGLQRWARHHLRELVQWLDDAEIDGIVQSAVACGTPADAAELLTGLLGDEAEAVAFVAEFNGRRFKHQEDSPYSKKKPKSQAQPPPKPAGNSTLSSDLGTPKKKVLKKVDALTDIDAAIRELELTDDLSQSQSASAGGDGGDGSGGKGRKAKENLVRCDCQARRHPLNPVTPNCLSCGKILCGLESPTRCAGCGEALLSRSQTADLLSALRRERGVVVVQSKQVRRRAAAGSGKSGAVNYSGKLGASFSQLDDAQLRSKADDAERRKDDLLEHVRTGAKRTVVDRASDFDKSAAVAADRWASPEERADALRAYLAEQRAKEEDDRRGTRVLHIDIGGKGKAVVRDGGKAPRQQTTQQVTPAQSTTTKTSPEQPKKEDWSEHGYDKNVLTGDLASTLKQRPSLREDKGEGEGARSWFQPKHGGRGWRRVQDDDDVDDDKEESGSSTQDPVLASPAIDGVPGRIEEVGVSRR